MTEKYAEGLYECTWIVDLHQRKKVLGALDQLGLLGSPASRLLLPRTEVLELLYTGDICFAKDMHGNTQPFDSIKERIGSMSLFYQEGRITTVEPDTRSSAEGVGPDASAD